MKKRLSTLFLALCLIVGLLPTAALAVLPEEGNGLTAENPMIVPADKMVIQNGTYYGISYGWFKTINPEKQTMYFSIALPATVTTIFDDGLRDSWSSQKENLGAATYYSGSRPTDWAHYNVVSIDFSEATNLMTINKQAAMSNTYLSGVLDLSNTKVETIGKNAFKECSGLTGVILPETLKNIGSDNAGSVFYGCVGLEYVRTVGGNPDSVFELPGKLVYLGNQSFYRCTGLPANTTVEIPASVTYIGNEVFNYTPSVTTIVVKTNNASQYQSGAFKISGNYGLGKRLTIFPNAAAKGTFSPSGSNSYVNSLTYEFTLHYGKEGGTDVRTEPKLYGQAVNVCKVEDGSWAVNADYEIPEATSANVPIGYSGGWAYNDKLLTTTTVLKPTGDHLYLDVQKVLQNPTVEFIVDGEKIETEDTYPKLQVPAGSTIGVQVSHPVEDVDVKFEYEWIDVCGGGSEGPRMEETGFGRYNFWNNPEVTNTITINGTEDERTSSGNYTDEDYGDGYYLLVIYGYSKPKSEGQWTKFYQSANTAIAPDPDRTVNTAYLFDVTIAEPITITPADITVYTGGEGYTGAVDNAGQESTTANGLPEPGYYVTLPDWINDQLGGDDNAENLSAILKFTYQDNEGRTREWKLAPYGTDAHSSDVVGADRQRYIYRILPGVTEDNEEIPVRLQFKDSNGNVVISDEFTPNKEQQYQEYSMNIYSGELEPDKITAILTLPDGQEVTCGVKSGIGKLVVRGLTNENTTTEIVNNEDDLKDGITALASEGVTYYVNGSNVQLNDTEGVKLLVDDVLDDGVLVEYIQENMTDQIPAGDYTYAQQYLDLVDTKNGNAYLTMEESDKLTIYWKVPDNFDGDKPFYVVHFDALDRSYDGLENALTQSPPYLIAAQLVTVKGTEYVKFDTCSFSPFVLVYGAVNTYTITATAGENGSISPSGEFTVTAGEDHTFTITPDRGYHIQDVLVDGVSVGAVSSYTFAAVAEDHTIKATFAKDADPVTRYRIEASAGEGGSISPEGIVRVSQGGSQSFTITPDQGYKIEDVLVDGESAGPVSEYTFKNVREWHTITVTFAKLPADPGDTGVSDWLDTEHHMAYLNGYPGQVFGPDRDMTRAEAAQMFYNLLLDKDVAGTAFFTDVSADAWYAEAVNTLASLGMIQGVEGNRFQPDRAITRAEFTAIAMRFTHGETTGENRFSDVNPDQWFYDVVVGAVQYGWINGYEDGTFRPESTIKRAEVAAITNRMLARSADEAYVDAHASQLRLFADVAKDHWAYYTIVEASNTHDYQTNHGSETWKDA